MRNIQKKSLKVVHLILKSSLNFPELGSVHSEKVFDWIKKIIYLKHFLWCEEMICLNETKFVWFKQIFIWFKDILFESNKLYLIQTNHFFKVVVVPKISLLEKKFFYDFKTGNYIVSRVICKERHSF